MHEDEPVRNERDPDATKLFDETRRLFEILKLPNTALYDIEQSVVLNEEQLLRVREIFDRNSVEKPVQVTIAYHTELDDQKRLVSDSVTIECVDVTGMTADYFIVLSANELSYKKLLQVEETPRAGAHSGPDDPPLDFDDLMSERLASYADNSFDVSIEERKALAETVQYLLENLRSFKT